MNIFHIETLDSAASLSPTLKSNGDISEKKLN